MEPKTTRETLSAWWQARPEVTRKLIPWLVGIWAVIAALDWFVWDTGWAGLARGTIALLVVGGLCMIWNEWRFGQRKVQGQRAETLEAAGAAEVGSGREVHHIAR